MNNRTIDPYYNRLYEQTHSEELYGTSSVAFLPEVMQSFLFYVKNRRIDMELPVRVLDYGCGRSILLDVFAKATNDNKEIICSFVSNKISLASVMEKLQPSLKEAMEGYTREQYRELLSWGGGIIHKQRFDPAIPEHAKYPQGPYDFLICTDVFEHIPEYGGTTKKDLILENSIVHMLELSPNPFLNISTRKAMQILPDGQNAHCTVKHPQEWLEIIQKKDPTLSPMFSRDFTSCHFVRGVLFDDFHYASCETYKEFGEVDLIAYPSKKALSPEKEAKLIAIQGHKLEIREQNLLWVQNFFSPEI